jgi:hypothetical protein
MVRSLITEMVQDKLLLQQWREIEDGGGRGTDTDAGMDITQSGS